MVMAVAATAAGAPPRAEHAMVAAAQPAHAVQIGRAVALSLDSVLADVTVADTGEVSGAPLSPVRRSVVNVRSPLVTADVADATVSGPDARTARSEVSIVDLQVRLVGGEGTGNGPALPPLLTISVGAVRVLSQSTCTAPPAGEVEIASLSINDIGLSVGGRPGPNATIAIAQLPLVSVVLNERIPAPGGNGLTVNALRIRVVDLVDLVIGSARSEVASCPPEQHDREPPVMGVGSGETGSGGLGSGMVRQGRVAVARGRGFAPAAPVRLTFDGSDLRPIDAIAGSDGTIEVSVVVPRDARLGLRSLTATSGDESTTAEFLVLRRPAQPPAAPFATEDGAELEPS